MSLLLLFDSRFGGEAVGGIDRGGIKHRPATLNVSYYKKKVKDKEVIELKSTEEFDKKELKNKVSPKIAKLLSETMVIADDATAAADIGNWGGNSMRAGVQRVGQPSYEPFRCRRRRRRHGAKAQHHNRISLQFAVPTAVCCCKRQLAVLRRAAAGEV